MVLEDAQIGLQHHGHAITRHWFVYGITDQRLILSAGDAITNPSGIFTLFNASAHPTNPAGVSITRVDGGAFSCTRFPPALCDGTGCMIYELSGHVNYLTKSSLCFFMLDIFL